MVESLKQLLYFPLAWYFRFFAGIRLRRWNPQIIVVTGSNGKTTLLHMLEAQLGAKAKYSHHANSAYGIPFDILDLHRKSMHSSEWISLFLLAPFKVFSKLPIKKLYVVEADADRPNEGKFLAELLQPTIVLWVSTSRTHSMNFDSLVAKGKFSSVDEAIAYEYGYFLKNCTKLSLINGDEKLQVKQQSRAKAQVVVVTKESYFEKYEVKKEGTMFKIAGKIYEFSYLLPEEIFYSLVMCREAVESLDLPFDESFSQFLMPPGRGSIFTGIKETVLIDSSYNANLGSVSALLNMFANFPGNKKWVVISDMLELGKEEREEHEKLADILMNLKFEKIILLGPRTEKYTFEKMKTQDNVVSFLQLPELRDYLKESIVGEEALLFKGSQSMYLDGIIEGLLKNKTDAAKLPRRGEFWDKKRKQVGI